MSEEATGWDWFQPTANVSTDAVRPSNEEIDVAISRCFGTYEGQRVLAWLREVTIEQPAFVPGMDASHGFAREGQNSLVREIERRIKRSKA